jgi:hypothetical protein
MGDRSRLKANAANRSKTYAAMIATAVRLQRPWQVTWSSFRPTDFDGDRRPSAVAAAVGKLSDFPFHWAMIAVSTMPRSENIKIIQPATPTAERYQLVVPAHFAKGPSN